MQFLSQGIFTALYTEYHNTHKHLSSFCFPHTYLTFAFAKRSFMRALRLLPLRAGALGASSSTAAAAAGLVGASSFGSSVTAFSAIQGNCVHGQLENTCILS